jgi:penicillin-binding protein 2
MSHGIFGPTGDDVFATPAHERRTTPEMRTVAVLPWLFLGLVVMLLIIIGRVAMLQIGQGDYFRSLSDKNRSALEPIQAERGGVFDRNGAPLLHNVPDFQVSVVPADLPENIEERRAIFLRLSTLLETQPEEIESKLEEFRIYPTYPVVVATGLSQEQAVQVGVMASEVPAVTLRSGMRREYTSLVDAQSLSHVLGYTGRITKEELDALGSLSYSPSDVVGKSGIEKEYEVELRGIFGKRWIERDAHGNQSNIIAEEPPVKGADLTLTLDLDLQKKAEEAVLNALKGTGLRRASVVALSPKTGEVLALVSLPGFDATLFSKGVSAKDYKALTDDPDHPLFPRASAGSLPSGSTFKIVVAAAALEEKMITAATTVFSDGGINVGQWFFPDWKAGGHGITNVTKAIAESVNTFFYIVGGGYEGREGLGPERITEYAAKFGFGSRTGIDLPREGAGFLPSPEWKKEVKKESWYIGDTYHISIGQGDILVTPLQVAVATSVFANGGKLLEPSVLLSLARPGQAAIAREPKVVSEQVVSPETISIIRQGMRQTTISGSARGLLGNLPFTVAAKTGTAQWNSRKTPHAWITLFAPYEDPEIVLTISVEEGGEGSNLPQRIASDIVSWYLSDR